MHRLRQDKLAVSCFALIIFVALVGLVGPFFYPAPVNGVSYENYQDSNNINAGPTRGEQILVTEESVSNPEDKIQEGYDTAAPLQAADALPAVSGLKTAGIPSVNGVTIEWDVIPGVSGYSVFRTAQVKGETVDVKALAEGTQERGIALAEITNPAQHSYTDSLGLDASETYVYIVVPFVDDPNTFQHVLGKKGAVVTTELRNTIKISDAQAVNPTIKVGDTLSGRSHLFGTDALGRDVFARMISGTRVDMMLALLVPTLSIIIGMILGAISGLMGGKTDLIMMRIVEIVDNFPDLLVFILLQVAFGKGVFSLVIALSAFSWAGFARIVRGEVLRLREIEFVQASRLLGAPVMRLVTKHIGPNLLGLVIIAWSARIPNVIASEAFLSLIGLGVEQPTPSWGNVVFDSARRLQVNPSQFFLPASVLGVTLLAFYLLGNSLRDAFDPKLRGRG
jgi:oligopeptide transport system permease protein